MLDYLSDAELQFIEDDLRAVEVEELSPAEFNDRWVRSLIETVYKLKELCRENGCI